MIVGVIIVLIFVIIELMIAQEGPAVLPAKNITRTQNDAGNQKLKIQKVIVEAILQMLRVMVIRSVGTGLGDRVSVIQTVLVVLMIVLLLIQINI